MDEEKEVAKKSTVNEGLETMHKYLGKAATDTIAATDTAYFGELDPEALEIPAAPPRKK